MRHVLTGVVLLIAAAGEVDAQVGRNQGLLEPNLASKEELAAVPQLNAAAVEAIAAGRPFLDMIELHRALLPHVGADRLTEAYRHLWIPLNLNASSREEILLVPGVGPRIAHEFEEYRPYVALVQFRRQIGKYVDDAELARLEQYVFVPIDLNTASEADILSIPGVGRRMLHEFLEYRPYRSLAQFRREIGKYVNERELARLERYVTIR